MKLFYLLLLSGSIILGMQKRDEGPEYIDVIDQESKDWFENEAAKILSGKIDPEKQKISYKYRLVNIFGTLLEQDKRFVLAVREYVERNSHHKKPTVRFLSTIEMAKKELRRHSVLLGRGVNDLHIIALLGITKSNKSLAEAHLMEKSLAEELQQSEMRTKTIFNLSPITIALLTGNEGTAAFLQKHFKQPFVKNRFEKYFLSLKAEEKPSSKPYVPSERFLALQKSKGL